MLTTTWTLTATCMRCGKEHDFALEDFCNMANELERATGLTGNVSFFACRGCGEVLSTDERVKVVEVEGYRAITFVPGNQNRRADNNE